MSTDNPGIGFNFDASPRYCEVHDETFISTCFGCHYDESASADDLRDLIEAFAEIVSAEATYDEVYYGVENVVRHTKSAFVKGVILEHGSSSWVSQLDHRPAAGADSDG